MSRAIDITGKRYGRLVVREKAGTDRFRQIKWLCDCNCGNQTIVTSGNLRNGHTTSCGCYNKQRISETHKKHGMFGTRLYNIWAGMIQRCNNPKNTKYKNYGARGISVCDEWEGSFKCFYEWAITNGYKRNLTIDRIDVNGNYQPTNCRWVGIETQENNRTDNIYITINGETRTLSEWCRTNGINVSTALQRIRFGWDSIRAVTEPPKRRKKND